MHAPVEIVEQYVADVWAALKQRAMSEAHSDEASIDAAKRALVAILVTLVLRPDDDDGPMGEAAILVHSFMTLCGYKTDQLN